MLQRDYQNNSRGNKQVAKHERCTSYQNNVMKQPGLYRSPYTVAYEMVHDDGATRCCPVAIEIELRGCSARG
jgi:hypothetical protein